MPIGDGSRLLRSLELRAVSQDGPVSEIIFQNLVLVNSTVGHYPTVRMIRQKIVFLAAYAVHDVIMVHQSAQVQIGLS